MAENPIGTREQREKLRRLIPPQGSKDIQHWAHPALDGLDIADMAFRAMWLEEYMYSGQPYSYMWDWDGATHDALAEALRRWQKWKGPA